MVKNKPPNLFIEMSYQTTIYRFNNQDFIIDRPLKARGILPKAKSERGYHRSLKPNLNPNLQNNDISTMNILESESKLEYDFLLLLDHDPNCLDIQTQPVEWIYDTSKRKNIGFYPDIWALFHKNGKLVEYLFEIKSEKEWKTLNHPDKDDKKQRRQSKNWKKKLKVIREECEKRGWIFQVITERKVYCQRLLNIKHCLLAAKFYSPSNLNVNIKGLIQGIKQSLKIRDLTIEEILNYIHPKLPHINKGVIISILKSMIYYRDLFINWNIALEESNISLQQIPLKPVYNLPDVFDQNETLDLDDLANNDESKLIYLSEFSKEMINPLIKKYGTKASEKHIRKHSKKFDYASENVKKAYHSWKRENIFLNRKKLINPIIDKFGADGKLTDVLKFCESPKPNGLGDKDSNNEISSTTHQKGVYKGYSKKAIDRYKLYLKFKRGGFDALWPKNRKSKNKSRLHPRVEEILQNAIQKWYNSGGVQKKAYYEIYFEDECYKEKKQGLIPPNEIIPTYKSFVMRTKLLPATESFGKFNTKQSISITKARQDIFQEGLYPGAIIQIDHTRVDLWLVDKFTRKLTLVRPWITFAIDVFSRSIWSVFISDLNTPNQETVMKCILNGIVSKRESILWNYFEKRAIEEGIDPDKFEWYAEGLPARIQVDNGRDFDAQSVKNLCMKLNITLSFRPVKSPEYGGYVESMNRTFNEVIHKFELDGRVFSIPKKRKTRSSIRIKPLENYNPKKTASYTLEDFNEFVGTYMVYYQNIQHAMQIHTPNEIWEHGTIGKNYQPFGGKPKLLSPIQTEFADFDTKREASSHLSEKGLRYKNIFYTSKWLINARIGRIFKDKEKIHFKYSVFDRRYIWIIDPQTQRIKKLTAYCYEGDDRIEKFILLGVGRGISTPFPISKWLLKKVINLVKKSSKVTDETDNILLREMMKKIKHKKKLDKFEYKFLGDLIINREDEKLETIIKLFIKTGQKLTLKTLLESNLIEELSYTDIGYLEERFFGIGGITNENKKSEKNRIKPRKNLAEIDSKNNTQYSTSWEEASKDILFWNIYNKKNSETEQE